MISRIKKIMENKQLNAAQFADEIGIKRSALSHVLSGRNNPSLDFMIKIKQRFSEINLDWLLMGSGSLEEKNTAEKTIQKNIDLFENSDEVELNNLINEKPEPNIPKPDVNKSKIESIITI